jgi:hypothetical protein
MDNTRFNRIKEKYQYYASWAVWAEKGATATSNVGDLSILDPTVNKQLLETLKPNIILVALNISKVILKNLLVTFTQTIAVHTIIRYVTPLKILHFGELI